MTAEQEGHLSRINVAACHRISDKYRRGQQEHGGDLSAKSSISILDFAIDEAVDQVVYLLTLREQLTGEM
jgi:hypothetical protein